MCSLVGSSPDVSLGCQEGDLINFLKDVEKFLVSVPDGVVEPLGLLDNKKSLRHRIEFFQRTHKKRNSDSSEEGEYIDTLPRTRHASSLQRPSHLNLERVISVDDDSFESKPFSPNITSTPLKSPGPQEYYRPPTTSFGRFNTGGRHEEQTGVRDDTGGTHDNTGGRYNDSEDDCTDDELYSDVTPRISSKQEVPGSFDEEEDYASVDVPINNKDIKRKKLNKVSNMAAKYLETNKDLSGWLWRKEAFGFKKPRYWAIIYKGYLYLFSDPDDTKKKAFFNLAQFNIKRNKASVSLIKIEEAKDAKTKPEKHKFEFENEAGARKWSGFLLKATHFITREEHEEDDEEGDYDTVAVSLQHSDDQDGEEEYIEPVLNSSRSNLQLVEPSRSNLQLVEPSRSNLQLVEPSRSNLQLVEPSRSNLQLVEPSRSNLQLVEPSRSQIHPETSKANQQLIDSIRSNLQFSEGLRASQPQLDTSRGSPKLSDTSRASQQYQETFRSNQLLDNSRSSMFESNQADRPSQLLVKNSCEEIYDMPQPMTNNVSLPSEYMIPPSPTKVNPNLSFPSKQSSLPYKPSPSAQEDTGEKPATPPKRTIPKPYVPFPTASSENKSDPPLSVFNANPPSTTKRPVPPTPPKQIIHMANEAKKSSSSSSPSSRPNSTASPTVSAVVLEELRELRDRSIKPTPPARRNLDKEFEKQTPVASARNTYYSGQDVQTKPVTSTKLKTLSMSTSREDGRKSFNSPQNSELVAKLAQRRALEDSSEIQPRDLATSHHNHGADVSSVKRRSSENRSFLHNYTSQNNEDEPGSLEPIYSKVNKQKKLQGLQNGFSQGDSKKQTQSALGNNASINPIQNHTLPPKPSLPLSKPDLATKPKIRPSRSLFNARSCSESVRAGSLTRLRSARDELTSFTSRFMEPAIGGQTDQQRYR